MNRIPNPSPRRSCLRLALCTAVAFLALASTMHGAPGRQYIRGGLPGGQPWQITTNGTPVIGSVDSRSGGLGCAGTMHVTLTSSDLSVLQGGPATYGTDTSSASTLDLWAYNQPGLAGPISITVTPYLFTRDWYLDPISNDSLGIEFTLRTQVNGEDVDLRHYSMTRTTHGGVTVYNDYMTPTTINVNDGDQVTFVLGFDLSAGVNWWVTDWITSVAWYTVGISGNGYLSTDSRLPANPPVPVLPPLAPQCTGATFTDGSHTQLTVSGTGGPTIAPLNYYVVTSTNLALPLPSWTPYQTNVFAADGTFTFNFPIDQAEPQRFFHVRMTP